jgi:uncharacterized membrane protein YbhN (UPF0104 family)
MSRPRRQRLRLLARAAFAAFAVVVAVLLLRYARNVDWPAVGAALAGYDAATLARVLGLVAASYLVYAAYDLAARRYAGHALSTRRVLLIAATSYAFALNLGALVGGAGFRFRMYAHSGLRPACIGRVVAFSMAANWLGYIALAGAVFAAGAVAPPPQWGFGGGVLRAAGGAMLLAALAYLLACRRWRGRIFHVRGHRFRLPTPALAALQMALAALNWALMASILFLLLGGATPWPLVLATLLLSAVASATMHIPAGIGVLEAVFVAVLGGLVAEPRLLAAVLAYRAAYYLLPLVLALGFYAGFEARRGKSMLRARPPALRGR